MKKLLNQINMRQKHPPTAISSQAEFIEGVTFSAISLQQGQVGVPLVTDNFAASEATNRDNHSEKWGEVKKGE